MCENCKETLKPYKSSYKIFKKEVLQLLNKIKNQHSEHTDIFNIIHRNKSLKKIHEKLNKFDKITKIQDIIGIRIICHCKDDREYLDDLLTEKLKESFDSPRREPKDDETTGYYGIHYIVGKKYLINGNKETLYCEIQLRTVMQDAWAIQSHQYGYGRKIEGHADTLKKVVSGILTNIESLWELVKKDVKSGGNDNG